MALQRSSTGVPYWPDASAPTEEPSPSDTRRSMLRRVVFFLLLFALMQTLYGATRGTWLERLIIDQMTVQTAARLIDIVSPAVSVKAVGSRLRAPGGGINVLNGCEGTDVMFLMACAMLVVPLAWRHRLTGEADAFGSTHPDEDPDGDTQTSAINLRYPGQYYDQESGLHYNHRRYYDPKLGRYMSPDPIGLAGGANLYGYVNGNPLSYVDSDGKVAQLAVAGGIVLAGLAAKKGMDFLADLAQMVMRAEMAASAQKAADAAARACQTYPQGGACGAMENLQRQVYQCTVSSASMGAAAAWNIEKAYPSSPIMPRWKPVP